MYGKHKLTYVSHVELVGCMTWGRDSGHGMGVGRILRLGCPQGRGNDMEVVQKAGKKKAG